MKIDNYSLAVKGKTLIENSNLSFYSGTINHIVGKNGVGKSQLAKDLVLNNSGNVPKNISSKSTLISSSSSVPEDITKDFLLKLLKNKFSRSEDLFSNIYQILDIDSIPSRVLIKNLSDGQKQKLKFLSFLLEDNQLVILDEVTNALDKKTVTEIQEFLNIFIKEHPNKTIINITHNLSDLKNIPGKYFALQDRGIQEYQSKDDLIQDYINL
ncbi:ATP-binding cassette domain-containing protein [Staphylococcus pettenkoferi]|uniref:ATP-binding cassette domain-containing protein n=2 Tax=Staphylococcus pettenkoferi TaxID=170573 RepID=UPI001C8CB41C|nr:ATP-binding cassette domain-containing protein [Staphylococcus pettenkoferi]MBX8993155.1 ATP-binding cassette domain-containing protein [Staphylococcus pettenkoferi]